MTDVPTPRTDAALELCAKYECECAHEAKGDGHIQVGPKCVRCNAADLIAQQAARIRKMQFDLAFWEARTDLHKASTMQELQIMREEYLRALVSQETAERDTKIDALTKALEDLGCQLHGGSRECLSCHCEPPHPSCIRCAALKE